MIYHNPIILSDYSDPDVIRHKNNYYMIASSFNHTPGVPVLKSKNLVNWKLIGYVFDELPFERFDHVIHGAGAWAPSIRFHNNKFYAVIPFPDEGIYVSSCTDIEKGDWSKPWCLIDAKGIEDPCPIWVKDKCYLVVGFVKSRIGFNSVLGLYEVTPDLKKKLTDYKIIFDGHNTQPTIEGPKFYFHNDYFYILAPAGSVKTGWQTALRSKNIYGPYEEKIIMCQNDSPINGPHQGALIDLPHDKWAFIHFQDLDAYGRVCHLQPARWINDWPICGNIKDEALCGSPYTECEYLLDIKSNYKIVSCDDFKGNKLSLMWQTPANKKSNFYSLEDGLKLNCIKTYDEAIDSLNLTPNVFLTKILYKSFNVKAKAILDLKCNGDETGLCMMGNKYSYICIKNINGINHIQIKTGEFNKKDEVIYDEIYNEKEVIFNLKYKYPNIYQLGINNKFFNFKFEAFKGRWIGAKYGIYAKGIENKGSSLFKYFKCKQVK